MTALSGGKADSLRAKDDFATGAPRQAMATVRFGPFEVAVLDNGVSLDITAADGLLWVVTIRWGRYRPPAALPGHDGTLGVKG
jgi:hypothetical protein